MSEQRSHAPQEPQRRPRVSRNRKKTHRTKAASALLYVLFVVGLSAVWCVSLLFRDRDHEPAEERR